LFKRTVPLLVLAALVIPAGAAAKDVSGPATLAGHGPVRGTLRSAEGPARVELHLSGKILISGRARDLEVSCTGASVKMRTAVNRRGLELVACKGRRMTVVVSATAFHFGALARRWLIQIPEGVSGKINGRFRMQDDSSNERPERPVEPAEPEAPAER
jgi:hypothetical protein